MKKSQAPQVPKIDFVVLWVDGNDCEWQKKKAQYMPSQECDASVNRYRDWGTLKYWFRGVAKFAPWVNRIYFVSDGQVPSWLNVDNPRLCVTDHKEYIPIEGLPIFNSNAIEVGIHRLPDLSDNFVHFNDDLFLTSPIEPSYYFSGDLPIDMPGLTRPAQKTTLFGTLMLNTYEVLNRHFSKKEVIKRDFFKWFSPFNGKAFLRTLRNIGRDKFDGIVIPHLSVPYRKSDFSRVWDVESALLEETQKHRFRDPTDLTHFLFRFWRFAVGDYKVRKSRGKYFSVTNLSEAKNVAEAIHKRKYPEICINDCYVGEGFEDAKNLILSAFDKLLPEKCEFEM